MIPQRLTPALRAPEPSFDPELSFDELVDLLAALQSGRLQEELEERVWAYLERNLPEAEVRLLLEWPGEWFQNRWYEEAALAPEELAGHLLARCGRELPGAPEPDEEE